MNTPEFTPGPWVVEREPNDNQVAVCFIRENKEMGAIIGASMITQEIDRETARQNALLMARAPELLEQVRILREHAVIQAHEAAALQVRLECEQNAFKRLRLDYDDLKRDYLKLQQEVLRGVSK